MQKAYLDISSETELARIQNLRHSGMSLVDRAELTGRALLPLIESILGLPKRSYAPFTPHNLNLVFFLSGSVDDIESNKVDSQFNAT